MDACLLTWLPARLMGMVPSAAGPAELEMLQHIPMDM